MYILEKNKIGYNLSFEEMRDEYVVQKVQYGAIIKKNSIYTWEYRNDDVNLERIEMDLIRNIDYFEQNKYVVVNGQKFQLESALYPFIFKVNIEDLKNLSKSQKKIFNSYFVMKFGDENLMCYSGNLDIKNLTMDFICKDIPFGGSASKKLLELYRR